MHICMCTVKEMLTTVVNGLGHSGDSLAMLNSGCTPTCGLEPLGGTYRRPSAGQAASLLTIVPGGPQNRPGSLLQERL